MRKLNIAIIGLGNIGSYLFNYLQKIERFFQKKIIVSQTSNMFQLKIFIVKEILKLEKVFGLKTIWRQQKLKILI